jgi:peptide/nickel transport system substrate-binding protein
MSHCPARRRTIVVKTAITAIIPCRGRNEFLRALPTCNVSPYSLAKADTRSRVALNERGLTLGIVMSSVRYFTGGKLKIRRLVVAAAVVAVGALALSGCTPAVQSEIVAGTSISIAQNSGLTSLNSNAAADNSTYNANIEYLEGALGFQYYDSTPKLVANTKFGTITKVSSNPLTVKYTVNQGVKWSDGDQVGAADLLLAWASSISKFNTAKGVNFTSAAAGGGLDLVTKTPKISDDNRSITLVYNKPFADWQTALGVGVPAHITYGLANPGTKLSPAKEDAAVIKEIKSNDTAGLTKLAKAWATGYEMTTLPSNKKVLVTDGPYKITALTKDYVTLTANKAYTWGPLPKVQKITVRFIADPTAQVQALENGEVSIISGQATADTLAAIKSASGINSTNTNESTYEHVDLTFNNKGPFDPASYGGDASKALLVRQAFLKALPRQDIVDKLIKPLNPAVKLDDSQMFLPGAPGYSESVAANGSSAYDTVDIAAAKADLAQAGVKNVKVEFGYPNDNPRRVSEFQLIQASEKAAGFNVVDDSSDGDTYFGNLGLGKYDAVVFAWQFTSLAVTANQPIFQTSATTTGGNYNGYSNTASDAVWKKLQSTTVAADQIKDLQAIDKNAWADAYGATLYQLPDLTAWSKKVSNVKDAPLAPTVFWNYWEWNVKK